MLLRLAGLPARRPPHPDPAGSASIPSGISQIRIHLHHPGAFNGSKAPSPFLAITIPSCLSAAFHLRLLEAVNCRRSH